MVTCQDCNKEFEDRSSLDQHYSAKHAKQPEASPAPKKSKKKLYAIVGLVFILIAGYFTFSGGEEESKPIFEVDDNIEINLDDVPRGFIHNHPRLTIIIKDSPVTVPANLGGAGNLHGGGLLPYHTHDSTGTLHMESSRPTAETVILGYFFETVWRQRFNSQCIMDFCNGPDGNMTMTVNGQQNFKFDKYIPSEGDDIIIAFR